MYICASRKRKKGNFPKRGLKSRLRKRKEAGQHYQHAFREPKSNDERHKKKRKKEEERKKAQKSDWGVKTKDYKSEN